MVLSKFAPLVAVTVAIASLAGSAVAIPRVDAGVHRALRKQGSVNLIVTFKDSPESILANTKEAEFATRGQQIASLVQSLENHAATTQQEVSSLLSREAGTATPLFSDYQSFWVSNQVFVKDATFELVEKLAELSSVAEIAEEEVFPLPTLTIVSEETTAANATSSVNAISPLATNEWGVTKVKADSVWAKGYNGKGVVVSSIDSGVLSTHEALAGNFRGSYGWYDPEKKLATPYDVSGHGTHTMGTIAGANGVGVAPGTTWMACKGCRADGCYQSDLLACFQFITCPTNTAGTSKDCTKAPKVVNNSWGGGQGSTAYATAINTLKAAGIIPIFSNGNAGPACGTANSPADLSTVIGVGATDINDGLADFSSKGPAVNGNVKPDVSAPGKDVRSAWNTGKTAYNTISGTSMAGPHVTGVVALLLSAKPTLTYDQVKAALTSTTDRALKASGYTCGKTSDAVFPNNQYGYGRVNALKAAGL